MDEKYRLLKFDAEELIRKIEKVIEKPPKGGFEEEIAFGHYEELLDKLQKTVNEVEYYSKPAKSGTLRIMDNGKFKLIDKAAKVIVYFSCGSSIECFVEIDDKMTWAVGRVEYTEKDDHEGYYFYCREAGHPYLQDGMKARIRTSK